MDEPTLGDALRARPPADPTYRPSLDPDTPGARHPSPGQAPRRGRAVWALRFATLGLIAVLAAGAVVIVGSMPSRPSDVAGPSPFQPAPMRNGRIAFDRDGDIWLAEADGSGADAITSGPDDDRAPSWSPRATWIAYWRGSGTDVELRAIRPDGTDDLLVARGPLEVGTVTWAYEGEQSERPVLSYVLQQPSVATGRSSVVLRAIIGSERPPEPIVVPGTAPAWSPDGTTLAFLTGRVDGRISLLSTATDAIVWQWPSEIVGGPSASGDQAYRYAGLPFVDPPRWSPDSTAMALAAGDSKDRDIIVRDATRVGARWSTTWDEWSPVWSPDGSELAWLRREALRTVIQMAAADGSSQGTPIAVDDNATALVGAPDGSGWLVVRPGGIDLVPRAGNEDAPRFSIDAPLSSGIVSWEAIPAE